jgi:hypothetical protein
VPSEPERITVRERLAPEITASLFANYRSAADAILELIDNAVDSRLPDRQLRVEVVVRAAFVQITTVGGQGMGPREVEANYLRWGASPKRGRSLLGQYGQGGKAAIGHLGQGFTIDASRPGDESAWQFSDTRYRDRSRLKVYELHPIQKRVDRELGYVRIRIEAVDRRVDAKRVSARLAETYRPLLEREALALTVNGARLRPAPVPTVERHEFVVETGAGPVTGWYGVLAEDEPATDPGVRCYRLGRLVGGAELFGHQGQGLQRLVGEVEISGVPLTMNKGDFERDGEAWLDVEERLHGVLESIVRRLSHEDRARPTASAARAAERVRRLLGRALRMVEGEAPLTGFEPARPTRAKAPTSQQELAMPEHVRRRQGFGRIALRPLDRALRSQTVVEDGVRVIVINTRHPLFLERRGDTWYQLETAARELFATVEGVSVADYERQVNEVVTLALELRTHRRRAARARQVSLALLTGD